MSEPVSQLLFEMILKDLAEGRSLLSLCQEYGVTRSAFRHFRDNDEARKIAYREARADGCDAMADECQQIADESQHDTKMGRNGPMMDAEYVARSKLRIDTRLKLLACFDPARYGAKLDVTTNGGDMKPLTLADFYKAADAPGAAPAAPTTH